VETSSDFKPLLPIWKLHGCPNDPKTCGPCQNRDKTLQFGLCVSKPWWPSFALRLFSLMPPAPSEASFVSIFWQTLASPCRSSSVTHSSATSPADAVFHRLPGAGIKRWVARYSYRRYICWHCKTTFFTRIVKELILGAHHVAVDHEALLSSTPSRVSSFDNTRPEPKLACQHRASGQQNNLCLARRHSALGPGLPEPISEEKVPSNEHRHSLPVGYRIVKRSVLGGLHHEYGLVKEAA
jgi:hypothetical protein